MSASDNDRIKTIGFYDKDLETTDVRVAVKPYKRFNEIHISSLPPFPESKFMHAEISGYSASSATPYLINRAEILIEYMP